MTGVEGYIESAATGLLAGINAARLLSGRAPLVPPPTTALGALLRYITDPERKRFQPMNVNFGLIAAAVGAPARQSEKRNACRGAPWRTWRRGWRRPAWLTDAAEFRDRLTLRNGGFHESHA